jgi:hypothetical protein
MRCARSYISSSTESATPTAALGAAEGATSGGKVVTAVFAFVFGTARLVSASEAMLGTGSGATGGGGTESSRESGRGSSAGAGRTGAKARTSCAGADRSPKSPATPRHIEWPVLAAQALEMRNTAASATPAPRRRKRWRRRRRTVATMRASVASPSGRSPSCARRSAWMAASRRSPLMGRLREGCEACASHERDACAQWLRARRRSGRLRSRFAPPPRTKQRRCADRRGAGRARE